MTRSLVACALVVLALVAAPLAGAPSTPGPAVPPEPRGELEDAAREYHASLLRLLPLRSAAAARAREEAASRRRLADAGLIARRDAAAAEQALAAADAALATTRAEIAAADLLLAEVAASALLASLPPATPGALTVMPMLMRFHGPGDWSLAQVPSVERFFAERFRRALPVSALGQTPAHDRLGFDHRNALDVAVHPDSAEGHALMAWLRERGVPFLAFRGRVAGEATGAHVHIGEPSRRLASPRAG